MRLSAGGINPAPSFKRKMLFAVAICSLCLLECQASYPLSLNGGQSKSDSKQPRRSTTPLDVGSPGDASITIICDLACTWTLDEKPKPRLKADSVGMTRVSLGWHVLTVSSADGLDHASFSVHVVDSSEQRFAPKLKDLRVNRLQRSSAENACNSDVFAACVELGYDYFAGNGIAVDRQKAGNLFQKACNNGYLHGCTLLGNVLPDARQKDAVALYRRACEGNEMHGCAFLGQAYLWGLGVDKDVDEAHKFLHVACEYGAQYGCVRLFAENYGEDSDTQSKLTQTGLADLRGGCNKGWAVDCDNLAQLLSTGTNRTPKDFPESIIFFRKACALGWLDACASKNFGQQ